MEPHKPYQRPDDHWFFPSFRLAWFLFLSLFIIASFSIVVPCQVLYNSTPGRLATLSVLHV
jgi:hypothetical protein